MRPWSLALAAIVVVLLASSSPAPHHQSLAAAVNRPRAQNPLAERADFNGDGFNDLAISVHLEDVGGVSNAGAVQALYGSVAGLAATGNQLWTQDSPGIDDTAETSDLFGRAMAAGDFNNDGFTDLAIGVPKENVGAIVDAGAVQVLYGSAAGLTATGSQLWTQDSPGIEDTAEAGDTFGWRLAVGDFNGDGFADLAVTAPEGEDIGPIADAGAVHVLYGSAAGLTANGNQFWSQDSPGIEDDAEPSDHFGRTITAADFNADGFDDLAVGALNEDVGSIADAGSVNLLYGSAAGLAATGNQLWTQDSAGVDDSAEGNDQFARWLGWGDFNGDGYNDLAVGTPLEDLGSIANAGVVHILNGSAAGLSSLGSQLWSQDSPDVQDSAERNDRLGWGLVAADFNGDGFADLAAAADNETLGAIVRAGAVHVLYGSTAGLTAAGNQFWTQDSSGIEDAAEAQDQFGWRMAAADFNGDGYADLAVGVHREDLGTLTNAGAVHALYGSAAGLAADGNQFWTQDSAGIVDVAEAGDAFGFHPVTR